MRSWFCKHSWVTLIVTKTPENANWRASTRILLGCKNCGELTEKMLLGETAITIKQKKFNEKCGKSTE